MNKYHLIWKQRRQGLNFLKPAACKMIRFPFFNICILTICLFLCVLPLCADTTPHLLIPRFHEPISIDGYLDEKSWKSALKVDDFYTYYPLDGNPAQQKTVGFMGYDDHAIYVAFICFDDNPEKIRASITRRDEILDDDHIVLFLDTQNQGKESYEFLVNPYGIQGDGIYVDMVLQDFTPDYIFRSQGHKFQKGFIVEVEIPFKSLRFPNSSELTFGMAIMRSIKNIDTELIWPKISRNSTTFVPQFAKIGGIKGVQPSNNIEILPELTSQKHDRRLADNDFTKNPFKFQGGVNLKYGPLPGIVFDMAVNPDFSQIEADADKIEVNRRFPLQYDEKRPFFLEGTNIFQTPINAVYTRRIVDPIAGLKFTGSGSGFEIGLLQAIDTYYGSETYLRDISQYQYLFDPEFSQDEFLKQYQNKNSLHSILRIKKNIFDYAHIGGLVTDKRFGDTYNGTYGIDGTFLIGGQYSLSFQALHSQTKDFFDLSVRSGAGYYANLFRGSRTFNFQLFYNDIAPDFEAANGFIERTDYREGGLQIWYDIRKSESFFSLIQPAFYFTRMYDYSGRKIESYLAPSITLEARGRNAFTFGYYRQFEEYAGSDFTKNWYYLAFSNKTFSWLFFDISSRFGDGIFYEALYYGLEPFLGYNRYLRMNLELRPLRNWILEFRIQNYLFEGKYQAQNYRTNQDIYRFKTTYQFTRDLALRFILEHNDYYQDFDINVLFSYQPFPGTVVFAGYNNKLDKLVSSQDKYDRLEQTIFFKISYLFRI